MLRLGDLAPDFETDCFFPGNPSGNSIHFSDFCRDSWCIFFSHPADFTPVCTTELSRVHLLKDAWLARKCKVLALSTDSVEEHAKWSQDILRYTREVKGIESDALSFPIVADKDLKVARIFGMLDSATEAREADRDAQAVRPPTFPVRAVYFIDPARRVRACITYPAAVGRNFDEIIRVLDALQLSDQHKIATPADWKAGDQVIVRVDVSKEEAQEKFAKVEDFGYSLLRMTNI